MVKGAGQHPATLGAGGTVLDLPDRVGRIVNRHPAAIVAVFVGLLLLSGPVLAGMRVYFNVYDVSPRTAYYDDYVTLNRQMGWDNLAFVLVTPAHASSVTTPAAIREMDAYSRRLEQLPYVDGVLSLASVVKLLNERATGRYALPPDNPAGNALIETYLNVSFQQFGDSVLYGNVVSRDHQAAAMIVTMPKGHSEYQYRQWNRALLQQGLELDTATPYHTALHMRPLSLDMIWIWVEHATVTEGPTWVAFAAAVAILSLYALYRRVPEVVASVLMLVIVMSVTLAAGYLVGVRFSVLSMIMMALIFGLGVDYCMHVTSRYREERALGYPREEAVSTAVRHVGSALWMSAITTTVGFASLYFSLIPAIGQFGIMLGAGILTAFLASLFFLPVLLNFIDRRRDEFPILDDPEAIASRREALTRELRAVQQRSLMGRVGRWGHEHRRTVVVATLVLVVVLIVPYVTQGVHVWSGSYTRPHPVLQRNLYPMQTLFLASRVFKIPVDESVMIYGNATDPTEIKMVKHLQHDLRSVHGRFYTESIIFPLSYYLNYTQQGRACGCDQDGDGIPDTPQALQQAYTYLRHDRTLGVAVQRVLTDDDHITAIRLRIDPKGAGHDLGSDVANYRKAREDTAAIVHRYEQQHPAEVQGVTIHETGLAILAVETVDAIVRGNAASIAIMLTLVFGLITWFWRRPVLSLITMVPIFLAILVQYSVTAALTYEVTYVSLIVTGGATGIGIDDAIHLVSRVREEITDGRDPREAVTLASSEIGSVLAGTTITDLSGFFLVMFSTVVWGAQTAIVVIPTLLAAFVSTVVLLPALIGWHAERHPEAYVNKPGRGILGRLLPDRDA